MKTLEEVKEHIHKVGYKEEAIAKICGFLIGKELKGEHETICFRKGINEFSSFLYWFNESEEKYPKAKVYKDDKWFDITFDEIYEELKKFRPVICDAALFDEMIEKILDELGIKDNESKNNSNKYKERELSIIDSMGLDKINPIALSTKALKAVNELLQRRNELEKELNETVD